MSMPLNADYTFYIDKLKVPTHERAPPPSSLPFSYSAMWLGHECQTTWQNMEMEQNNLEIYRNLEGAIDMSLVQKLHNGGQSTQVGND